MAKYFLPLALLCWLTTPAQATDRTLSGTLTSGVYYSTGKLTTAANCQIAPGSTVYLLAQNGVLLNPGFSTGAGTVFKTVFGDHNALPPLLDIDGDGLLDQWEVQNFGDTLAGPDDDSDGDGISNLVEFDNSRIPRSWYEYDPLGRIKRIILRQ